MKTIFLCQYLADEVLRHEIHQGLQVVENWNSGNSFFFCGKDSDLTGEDREHQETSMLAPAPTPAGGGTGQHHADSICPG